MLRLIRSSRHRLVSGFTLVEMVTVLLVLGILGTGVVTFIGDSSNGFAATVARAQLADDARFLVDKLSDEIREALPNSIRTNGQCLEYVPVEGGSRYHTLPIGAASDGFYSWPIDPAPTTNDLRVAVYPQSDLYRESNPGALSPTVSIGTPEADNRVRLSFSSPHAFSAGTSRSSYFLVATPVSYCTINGRLYRYQNYGFEQVQPGIAALPTGLPDRALAGEGVSANFSLSAATLRTNSIVAMEVELRSRGETVQLNHLAHVRNAP